MQTRKTFSKVNRSKTETDVCEALSYLKYSQFTCLEILILSLFRCKGHFLALSKMCHQPGILPLSVHNFATYSTFRLNNDAQ